MPLEITDDQARAAAALRLRWPGARVVAHPRRWGVILEARRDGHVVEVTALRADGRIEAQADLRPAA
jgi:hypothetical protein